MPSPRWTPEILHARRLERRAPSEAPLVWIAVGVGLGFLVQRALCLGFLWMAALAVIGLLAWRNFRIRREDARAAVALLLAVAAVGGTSGSLAWEWFSVDNLGRYARRDSAPVCLEATVLAAPIDYPAAEPSPFRAIPSEERSVVHVRAERLRNGQTWVPLCGEAELVVQGAKSELRRGQQLRVFGQFRSPSPALNPGQICGATSARAERVLGVVWSEAPECVTVLGKKSTLWEDACNWLESVRGWTAETLDQRIGLDQAPVVRAMVLGDRTRVTDDVVEAFRRTGMLHLLVVSGLHIGFIALPLPLLSRFGWFPRRWALVISLLLVLGYVMLSGARPPALRAGVLIGGACVALLMRREAIGANSLAAAALLVFVVSPGAWLSPGAQLSFLAAASLLFVSHVIADRQRAPVDPLQRLIVRSRSPVNRLLRNAGGVAAGALIASVAIMLVAGPLIAWRFHLITPVAAPLSLVAIPAAGIGVVSGIATLFAEAIGLAAPDWLRESLVWAPSVVCTATTRVLVGMLVRLHDLPAVSSYVPGPAGWWVGAWSVLLGVGVAARQYRPPLLPIALRCVLLLLAVGVAPALARWVDRSDDLRCSVIAVGHGSALLVQGPDGGAVLLDAGALGSPERATETIAAALWSQGVRRLDGVVLSHADVDHYNALPGLLDRFPIRRVWTSTMMFPSAVDPTDRAGPAELKRLLEDRGVPIKTLVAGDRLRMNSVRFRVLHPTDIGVGESDNADSLVLGVEHDDWRVLVTGDLESAGLDRLLAQEPYDCDLLIAPHHGSPRSDPPGLARWCQPEHVAISSGSPHPATGEEYRSLGSQVYNTHTSGMLTYVFSEQGLSASSFLFDEP